MNLHFEELTGTDGARIGIASLDAEKSLNALSLPMINALSDKLNAWAKDPQIVCVLLRGNGAKAFCAGGEVRSLVEACRAHPGEVPPLAAQFFAAEYRLDYSLHTYPKPLICWGHGYVLGGGMGLLQGASTRIVTPSSRLAMPEITIGLYPDVGASWFLARLPGKLGLFLGLTGAHMNGRDAIDLDLADRFLLDEQQPELIEGLLQLNWQEQTDMQLNSLLKALQQEAVAQMPEAQWLPRRQQIDELLDVSDVTCAWKAISLQRDSHDPLIARAAKTMSEGSPLTAHLVWEQIHPRPAPVAGGSLSDGIHPEPQLLPASGVQRRRSGAVDRQGSEAALALAGHQQCAGCGGRGALSQGLGGAASVGGSDAVLN